MDSHSFFLIFTKFTTILDDKLNAVKAKYVTQKPVCDPKRKNGIAGGTPEFPLEKVVGCWVGAVRPVVVICHQVCQQGSRAH